MLSKRRDIKLPIWAVFLLTVNCPMFGQVDDTGNSCCDIDSADNIGGFFCIINENNGNYNDQVGDGIVGDCDCSDVDPSIDCVPAFYEPYYLTVDSAPAVQEGLTTYRFYVNAEDNSDRMISVFGNDQAHLVINTPGGIFNSPFNPSWNASGVNPAFLAFLPDLADDSYATIGLEGPAATSGTAGAGDPSLVEDSSLSPTISGYFTAGGSSLNVNTLTGGSWYVVDTYANALPSQGRWLIAQITTAGSISGQINYQIFPLGVVADQQQLTTLFDGAGTFAPSEVEGCTDNTACNYNNEATIDDGSCLELDVLGVCGGDCGADADSDGICDDEDECIGTFDDCGICNGDNSSCTGCMIELACNYDPEAIYDDGSCEFYSCASLGCTDSAACNYNANAIYEDGSCTYTDALGECGGTCEADHNGNGICDDAEIVGCMDASACNYDSTATVDDQTCIPDNDEDGICDDVDECIGHYDTCGLCNGPGAIYECGCSEIQTGDCDCDGNQLDALGVCGGTCLADDDEDGICDSEDDCVGELDECGVCNGDGLSYECGCDDIPAGDCDCNGNQIDAIGICGGLCEEDLNLNGICDDEEIQGCLEANAVNFDYSANVDDGSCVFDEDLPDGWSFNPTPSSAVVLGNVTIDGIPVSEPCVLGAFSQSGISVGYTVPFVVENTSYFSLTVYGDDLSTEDIDGMSEGESFSLRLWLAATDSILVYRINGIEALLEGWTNTNGAPLSGYANPQSTYDFASSENCNNVLACNYNSDSVNDEDCIYPEFGYDCEGVCLNDADGDAVCDEFELLGCTDSSACNFNEAATEEDGSCTGPDECGVCGGDGIPAGDCDCDGNQLDALSVCGGDCDADTDADGICDDVDDCVGELDACGVCNGSGEIYDCGCADIPAGDCDCDGNQLDALGECGGPCLADADADGICDDVDDCVGALDECGICNGPGAIYECGCSDIPEGDCDCDGNQLDALGECGGACVADADADGICDDEDDCVGALDACGICNGPGAIYECGCSDIPQGDCDCDGNQLDALGVCGGDCAADADADGICDDEDDCLGELDACGICNGPGAIYECGCSEVPEGDCDCDGNQLDALDVCGGTCVADEDADGICDDVDDCVGEYDALDVCNGTCIADDDDDGVCDDSEILGCDDPMAVNYEDEATENDGSCNYEGLEAPEGFQFTPGPSSGTVLGTVTLNGLPGNGLDWIGAFTTQGLCAGASNLTVFEGQSYASLTIYGDDPTTPDVVEGMEAGGTFSLRLYDQSEDLIISYNSGQQFSGWLNTNGGALPGFSNPETVYAFFTPVCPDTDGDGICNDEDDCPNQASDAIGVCGGDCPYDFNNNGVCDDTEVFGCTYETATNYNPAATTDDGTCEMPGDDGNTVWATCFGDLNSDGLIQLNDLLDILMVYGTACE